MSEFQPFQMERYMSAYEQEVDYNLSESGVHPMLLRELLSIENTSFEELLKRLPDLELAGDEPLPLRASNFIVGIEKMPVRFAPR